MKGEPVLSIRQLEKIAEYFNRSLLFFLESGEVSEDKIYSPQFRTINNQKPIHDRKLRALIEHIEEQRQVCLGLMEDLGEPIKNNWMPEFALNKNNIKQASARVRQWLSLPDRYKFEDLRQAIESKGIMVFVTSGYKGKWQIDKKNPVRGFSLYYDTLPIIVVKKQTSEGAQARYDDYKALKEKQKAEREREEERQKMLEITLVIPRKYRHREPLNTFGKPFVNAVFDSFYGKHITLSKASTYLDNLKISDMHILEKYV